MDLTTKTETPEEKEALDNIKVTKVDDKQSVKAETEHQKEMAEFWAGWKNGDECIYRGDKCFFIGGVPMVDTNCRAVCFVQHNSGMPLGVFDINELSKPESPEDKEERERLESAKYLYSKHCAMLRHPVKDLDNNNELLQAWLAIVDKTKYRKGVE
mgnify:CR=1 FL=1